MESRRLPRWPVPPTGPTSGGSPTTSRHPARRSLPVAHAQAVRLCRTRRHQRAHRHEPRPAHHGHCPPPDRTRHDRARLRHPRSLAGRLRLSSQRGPQLSRLAGRHLRLSQPDSPPGTQDRPHRRRADPSARRRAGQFRPHAGRSGQRHPTRSNASPRPRSKISRRCTPIAG